MSTQKPGISFLCLLLSAAISLAAGIDAPAKLTVPKGQLTRVEVTQVEGKPLIYKSTADEAELFVDELVSKSGKLRLVLQGQKEGTYYLAFVRESEIVFTQVVIGSGEKEKEKDDKKTDPVPTPFSGKLKAYLITESADKNVAYGKIFSDKKVTEYWTSRQYLLPVIADPNTVDPGTGTTPEKLKPYIDRAKGKSDQLYLVDISTGKVLYEGNAPTTADALLAVVGAIRQ